MVIPQTWWFHATPPPPSPPPITKFVTKRTFSKEAHDSDCVPTRKGDWKKAANGQVALHSWLTCCHSNSRGQHAGPHWCSSCHTASSGSWSRCSSSCSQTHCKGSYLLQLLSLPPPSITSGAWTCIHFLWECSSSGWASGLVLPESTFSASMHSFSRILKWGGTVAQLLERGVWCSQSQPSVQACIHFLEYWNGVGMDLCWFSVSSVRVNFQCKHAFFF